MIGTQVGPYTIMRELGAGGMGAVYEAVHTQLGRRVALKVLKAELASSTETLLRFFNEARAVNHVEHPGLVQISDYGSLPNGSPYLVMELLRGETLATRLRVRSRLTEPEAVSIIEQLASILEATHEQGIVHRDVKPSNIMLVPDPAATNGERVKLLDFGIAKIADSSLAGMAPRTQTGASLGTPLYMSPEQCIGAAEIDGKADVYSLGVIFFELLSGRPPFDAENPLVVLNMHVQREPPPLHTLQPGISDATTKLVYALLSKDKKDRPSASQLRAAYRPVRPPSPASLVPFKQRYWARWLALVVTLGLAMALAIALLSTTHRSVTAPPPASTVDPIPPPALSVKGQPHEPPAKKAEPAPRTTEKASAESNGTVVAAPLATRSGGAPGQAMQQGGVRQQQAQSPPLKRERLTPFHEKATSKPIPKRGFVVE